MTGLVLLLSNPRSLATAFERCVIARNHFSVLHEPWCSYYWGDKLGCELPKEKIPEHYFQYDKYELLDVLIDRSKYEPVFVKDFAYSLLEVMQEKAACLRGNNIKFVYLVRDPLEAMTSFHKACGENNAAKAHTIVDQMSYENLYECYSLALSHCAEPPLVLRSSSLQENPQPCMKIFCDYVGIDFDPKMLAWKNDVLPKGWELGEAWKKRAINSQGFGGPSSDNQEYFRGLAPEQQASLSAFADSQRPFYDKFLSRAAG